MSQRDLGTWVGGGATEAFTQIHTYSPFGEETTVFGQDTERLKFTGHTSAAWPAPPGTGRFLAVDPIEGRPTPSITLIPRGY